MNTAPPNTDHATVIIEAGFEGGSLTMLGIRTANRWRFRIVIDEGTMFDLSPTSTEPARAQVTFDESRIGSTHGRLRWRC